jgi:N,N'-diacetylchitobiose transport system substrate-binding protein
LLNEKQEPNCTKWCKICIKKRKETSMKKGLLAAFAASALVLSGCAASETPAETSSVEETSAVVTGDIRVWINGGDTPQDARDYLKATFESQNPGSTLTLEQQDWGGLVEKLTTNMSGGDSPDVVEIGNTWSPGFTSALAFTDLTSNYEELGGSDLLPGFVEVGTFDGKFYAAPYYSGARLVFFSKADYAAAGVTVPATLDEYVSNAEKLKAATGNSGVFFPGKDWYNALPYIWENGGEIAKIDGGVWDSQLSSPASLRGLEMVKRVMDTSLAAKDGDEAESWVAYCTAKHSMLSAPSWAGGLLVPGDERPCERSAEDLGVFALPGLSGGAAQVFAGGSNIAIPKNSTNQELALAAVKIMLSPEYQSMLGAIGLVPALTSLGSTLGEGEIPTATAAAAANSKLTPASPNWADVEASGVLQDLFVKIATGSPINAAATAADEAIEAILNK